MRYSDFIFVSRACVNLLKLFELRIAIKNSLKEWYSGINIEVQKFCRKSDHRLVRRSDYARVILEYIADNLVSCLYLFFGCWHSRICSFVSLFPQVGQCSFPRNISILLTPVGKHPCRYLVSNILSERDWFLYVVARFSKSTNISFDFPCFSSKSFIVVSQLYTLSCHLRCGRCMDPLVIDEKVPALSEENSWS